MKYPISLLAVLLWFGCGSEVPPVDVIEPTLSSIQAEVFDKSCLGSSCHGGINARGDLNLEAGRSFAELDNKQAFNAGAHADGKFLIVPGDPDNSYFFQKLDLDLLEVGEGQEMPPGSRQISPEAMEAIRQWILQGALNN